MLSCPSCPVTSTGVKTPSGQDDYVLPMFKSLQCKLIKVQFLKSSCPFRLLGVIQRERKSCGQDKKIGQNRHLKQLKMKKEVKNMKCQRCGYEDMIFSLPANLLCPNCGYNYMLLIPQELKTKKRKKVKISRTTLL